VSEPHWLGRAALLVLHDRSLALHGGAPGVRDEGLLDSALARPPNRFHYQQVDDLCALAAIYLVGLAANHPFVDGNKRMAFLAAGLFLRRNGLRLQVGQAEAARIVFAVAGGERDEAALTVWLRRFTAEA
jgi:death-on-curing protein